MHNEIFLQLKLNKTSKLFQQILILMAYKHLYYLVHAGSLIPIFCHTLQGHFDQKFHLNLVVFARHHGIYNFFNPLLPCCNSNVNILFYQSDQPLMLSCLSIVRGMHATWALSSHHFPQHNPIAINVHFRSNGKIVNPLRSHVTSSSPHPCEA